MNLWMKYANRLIVMGILTCPLWGMAQDKPAEMPQEPKEPPKFNYDLPPLPDLSQVVATVNDEPITAEFLARCAYDWFAATVIEDLILERIVEQEARKQGITVSAEEVERAVLQQLQNAESRVPPGMSLEDFLKRSAFPPSRLYSRVRTQLLAERLVEREVDLTNFLEYSQIVIRIPGNTPEDQEKNAPEAEQKAKQAYEAIQNGLDFAEAVKQYSEDPFSKDRGGKMPWQNKNFLVPDIRQQLDNLSPGQVSQPFRTLGGYMIVKLDRRGTDASPEEQAELRQQGVRLGLADYIRKLQSQAKITNTIVQPYNPEEAPAGRPAPRPVPR